MQRFLLRLAYDGSAFQGWQKQLKERTVQGVLERALEEIAKETVKTTGSSRTDTGVHALNQYVHFDFPVDMSPRQIKLALTRKLTKDIKIIAVYPVAEDFHARYDASGRAYRFIITKELTPFNRLYKSYFPRHRIVKERIRSCLPLLMGSNDFEYFSQRNTDINNTISNVSSTDFLEREEDFVFEITAHRFLHNMVRRIIGTMVKFSSTDEVYDIIKGLLAKESKYQHLVYTAPPQGLYLMEVLYPEPFPLTAGKKFEPAKNHSYDGSVEEKE